MTAIHGQESMGVAWNRFAKAYEAETNEETRQLFAKELVQAVPLHILEKINYHGTIRRGKAFQNILQAMMKCVKYPMGESILQSIALHFGADLRGEGTDDRCSDQEILMQADAHLSSAAAYFSPRHDQITPVVAMKASMARYNLSFVDYSLALLYKKAGNSDGAQHHLQESLRCLDKAAEWEKHIENPAKTIQTQTRKAAIEFEQEMVPLESSYQIFLENRKKLWECGAAGGKARLQSEGLWYLNAAGRQLETILKIRRPRSEAVPLLKEIASHPMCEDWSGGKEAMDQRLQQWGMEIQCL